MITYIYFVKCPNCEDEHFDFFDEAKEFALGCLSQKPIITQTEVCRNDFGECTDSADLGTVWSWEDMMSEGGYTEAEPTKSIFTKDDLKFMADGQDPEFDALDNSVDFEPGTSEAPLDEDLEYEFKPTELQKAKAEVFKLNGTQRFKEDETLPQIYALYKELAAADPEGKTSASSGFHTTAEDFLDFYTTFQKLKADREIEVNHNLDDDERRDLLTGAATIKFKSNATKDKLMTESIYKASDRKPIPEGMTIEQLVEEMEENEDTVECTWCEELFDKSECRKEVDLGWLCSRCQAAIMSRGESLTFKENNYWDFLDEDLEELSFSEMVADSVNHLINDLGKDSSAEDFTDDVIKDIENNYDTEVPEDPEKYRDWASAVACEVSRQLNNQLGEALETKTWICYWDGVKIGTVEATDEDDANYKMQQKYPEYPYGKYKHDDRYWVELENAEDLTEASLSDIAAAANSEFGSSWNSEDLLDMSGVEDDFRRTDIHTGMTPSEKLKYDREQEEERAFRAKLASWKKYQKSKQEDLDPEELHDLGNEYDGGYPAETQEVSDSHLKLCPECGKETFDIETGICVECGFN